MDARSYDAVSVGVTGIVAIIAVTMIVTNLSPPVTPEEAPVGPRETLIGRSASLETARVPVRKEFAKEAFDFNEDGVLDLYDYQDVILNRVDCERHSCDLNQDGLIDGEDQRLFQLLLTRLYDYNNNQRLDRQDPLFLREVILGNRACNENHVCDVNGDGSVSKEDITIYTALLFNYDASTG